jgi:hypothetical protein
MPAETFDQWQRRTANFVSLEHDVPLLVAQGFLHWVNLMILANNALKDEADRDVYDAALRAMAGAFGEALGLTQDKLDRVIDEICRAYRTCPTCPK